MGTRIPVCYMTELLRLGARAVLWLDPDAAGQSAANKYRKQLIAYGIPVQSIVSERDPKLHFVEDIRKIYEQSTW